MRKISVLLLSAVIAASFTGCSIFQSDNEKKEEESSAVSDIENSKEESSKETSEASRPVTGNLLENSFGKLWKSKTYYVDVKMTVEAYGESTESDESVEDTAESQFYIYDYIIAVDSENALAGLNMIKSDSTYSHYVIKNNYSYDIDDSAGIYTVSPYPDGEVYFAEQYTTDICLGMTDYLVLEDSGSAKYSVSSDAEEEDVQFEKYKVTTTSEASGSILGDATVTYYFKDGVPYAEVMKTAKGQTTFEFRTVSNKIETEEIFEIPEDYTSVSEEPSSNSAATADSSIVTESVVSESTAVSNQASTASGTVSSKPSEKSSVISSR